MTQKSKSVLLNWKAVHNNWPSLNFFPCKQTVHWQYTSSRAMIIGPEDTPYENGIYLFDIFLPPEYPEVPPKVQFLTTGGGRVRLVSHCNSYRRIVANRGSSIYWKVSGRPYCVTLVPLTFQSLYVKDVTYKCMTFCGLYCTHDMLLRGSEHSTDSFNLS